MGYGKISTLHSHGSFLSFITYIPPEVSSSFYLIFPVSLAHKGIRCFWKMPGKLLSLSPSLNSWCWCNFSLSSWCRFFGLSLFSFPFLCLVKTWLTHLLLEDTTPNNTHIGRGRPCNLPFSLLFPAGEMRKEKRVKTGFRVFLLELLHIQPAFSPSLLSSNTT